MPNLDMTPLRRNGSNGDNYARRRVTSFITHSTSIPATQEWFSTTFSIYEETIEMRMCR
jgi:hypothetical protein